MPDVAALVQNHGYWVLGLVVLLENAGVPVPGETALLAAGYLTSPDGGQHLALWPVVLVAFVAAVVGDNVWFALGNRLARRRLDAGRRFLLLTPERMKLAERYFDRYGSLTVFFARFVTGIRVIAGPAAGAAGMPWPRFVVANAAGALCWATAVTLAGHFAGHAWEAMRSRIGDAAWVVLGVLTVGFVAWRAARWFRGRRSQATSDRHR
jgi:membrane protein DedA with SNARE-associated domain